MVGASVKELQIALRLLHAAPQLSGLVINEEGGADFAQVRQAVTRLWGPGQTFVLPHSADRIGVPAEPVERRCVLLPNAHLHDSALLQSLLAVQSHAGPRSTLTFVAVYYAAEGRPLALLEDRAAIHLPAPTVDTDDPRCVIRAHEALDTFAAVAHNLGVTGHRGEYYATLYHRAWEEQSHELGPPEILPIIRQTLAWRALAQRASDPARCAVETDAPPPSGQTATLPEQSQPPSGAEGASSHGRTANGDNGVGGVRDASGSIREAASASGFATPNPQGLQGGAERPNRRHVEPEDVILPPGWLHVARRSSDGRLDPRRSVSTLEKPISGPLQRLRQESGNPAHLPGSQERTLRSRPTPNARIDWHATLLEALKWQRLRNAPGRRLVVRRDDLRYKVTPNNSAPLYVILLDSSASMVKHRIEKAKGLVAALLDASSSESRYALIACGGERARVVVQPTPSTRRVRRAVRDLAIGGGTPLADALRRAAHLVRRYVASSDAPVDVLIFTDGGTGRDNDEELVRASAPMQALSARLLFVDTRPRFAAGGRVRPIADALGADYASLARLAEPLPRDRTPRL